MQMNKYVKKWVKALRSKEYKQTRGRLHAATGGFCCLGVACDVLKDEVNGKWLDAKQWEMQGQETKWYRVGRSKNVAVSQLPNAICTLLFGEEYDEVIFATFENKLIEMNDDKKKGFVAIANAIEKFFADYQKPRKRVSKCR